MGGRERFMAFVYALGAGLWLVLLLIGLGCALFYMHDRMAKGGVFRAFPIAICTLLPAFFLVLPTVLCVPHFVLGWQRVSPTGERWYTVIPGRITEVFAAILIIAGIIAVVWIWIQERMGSGSSSGSSAGGSIQPSVLQDTAPVTESVYEFRTNPRTGLQERRTRGGFLMPSGDWESESEQKDGLTYEHRQNQYTGVQEHRLKGGFLTPSGDWKSEATSADGLEYEHRTNPDTGVQESRTKGGFLAPAGEWRSSDG